MKKLVLIGLLVPTVAMANGWNDRGIAHQVMFETTRGNQHIDRTRDSFPILEVDRVATDLTYRSELQCLALLDKTSDLVKRANGKLIENHKDKQITKFSRLTGAKYGFSDGTELYARCTVRDSGETKGYVEASKSK